MHSPVTLLFASGDTDDFLASNDILGELNQNGPDGTVISSETYVIANLPSSTRDNENVLRLELHLSESTDVGSQTSQTDSGKTDVFGLVRQVATQSASSPSRFNCVRR